MPDPVWYNLRKSRADPPGLAGSDAVRRGIYTSGLHQFDELFGAARQVTAASRPLLIYYGLSQGGRSIVAAHGADMAYGTHGLSRPSVSLGITKMAVEPKATGAFPSVCKAIGSPIPTGAVELGAAWGAIPDLWGTRLPQSSWPRALPFDPIQEGGYLLSVNATAAVIFDEEPTKETLPGVLDSYPTTTGWVPGLPDSGVRASESGFELRLAWQAAGQGSESDRMARLREVAPEYRFRGQHWLRPVLGGVQIHPLMAWWALLYMLSILARYHPAEWLAALNLDASPLAVPLDDALEEALEAVPHLVLEAILQDQVLLRST